MFERKVLCLKRSAVAARFLECLLKTGFPEQWAGHRFRDPATDAQPAEVTG
jgi:hypothetical protein